MGGYVYILASRRNGTLYTGVTSDIVARVARHREDKGGAFTRKYSVHLLGFVEHHDRVEDAIAREKAIKKWRRAWKLQLIESVNPDWEDLFERLHLC
jgi:putative endonuclease